MQSNVFTSVRGQQGWGEKEGTEIPKVAAATATVKTPTTAVKKKRKERKERKKPLRAGIQLPPRPPSKMKYDIHCLWNSLLSASGGNKSSSKLVNYQIFLSYALKNVYAMKIAQKTCTK